jgi:F1F0 ATPase subunit 2
MMTDPGLVVLLPLSVAILVGVLAGWLFCLSLWRSVKALPVQSRPSLPFGLSALLRIGLVVTVFVLVSHFSDWPYLMVSLLSFIVTRRIYIHHRLGQGLES